MHEWHTISLREANVSLIDCEHRTPPEASSGYPYIAIPQIKHGRIDVTDARRISHEHFIEWTRKAAPQPYDVVLSRRCNPGETAFVPPGLEFALGQNLVLLRADGTKVYPPFLRWLVRGKDWWEQIGKFINVGAVFDSLKCAEIPHFQLRIPPLPEQRVIAYILGTLDGKIDLNQRMNETLESMARAIFKSWFVDFDPVHAKAEGRQPYGMDAPTAALFPNSFDDSVLGKIPSGWKVDEIRTRTTNIQYGLTRSAATDPVGPRFLRITDIQGGRVDWSRVPFCAVSDEEHQKYRICPGDILVARTGASTGENIYIIDAPDAVFASYLVRVQFADLSFARMVGEYMRSVAYFDHVAGAIGGSAQPNASAQVLASAPLTFPPIAVARTFLQLVAPLDSQRLLNSRQNQTLISIRDALVPKLISGEIRIRNADKLVGAST
jgi:type I restriction enzyme, S subunit